MRELNLPKNDHGIAVILRDAIAQGQGVTLTDSGKPVLDLIPRRTHRAAFHTSTSAERAAVGVLMDEIRMRIHGRVTFRDIASSKHEGHSY